MTCGMARFVYCKEQGKVVPIAEKRRSKPARSEFPAPHIQTGFQPYRSMATNEIIDDPAKHRAHLREHNLAEVGDSTPDWIQERRYVRKHGGDESDYSAPTPEPDPEGISFEWQDTEDAT